MPAISGGVMHSIAKCGGVLKLISLNLTFGLAKAARKAHLQEHHRGNKTRCAVTPAHFDLADRLTVIGSGLSGSLAAHRGPLRDGIRRGCHARSLDVCDRGLVVSHLADRLYHRSLDRLRAQKGSAGRRSYHADFPPCFGVYYPPRIGESLLLG